MIITSAAEATAKQAGWTSLARRGMLWSEVQVFDVTVLAAQATGPGLDPDCHELLYCVAGAVNLTGPAGSTQPLRTGQCLAITPGEDLVTVTAGDHGGTVLRIRALPATTSRQLPARRPSLDDDREPAR